MLLQVLVLEGEEGEVGLLVESEDNWFNLNVCAELLRGHVMWHPWDWVGTKVLDLSAVGGLGLELEYSH